MLKLEYLRLLRSSKWKYSIFVMIGSFLYYCFVYSIKPISLGTGMFSPLTFEQLMCSIALMVVFLSCYLVYEIAYDDERLATWIIKLAYPLHPWRSILTKECILVMLQPILALPSMLVYYCLIGTWTYNYLVSLWMIQLLYFTAFHVFTYYTSKGYLYMGFSVAVVNIMKRLLPLFLCFCILNFGEWEDVFLYGKYYISTVCCFVWMILLIYSKQAMQRKVERELCLMKLLSGNMMSQGALMLEQYRNMLDLILQLLFYKFDTHKETYWKVVATIEVTIKQQFMLILLLFFTLGYGIIKMNPLAFVVGIACALRLGNIYIKYRNQIKKIQFIS